MKIIAELGISIVGTLFIEHLFISVNAGSITYRPHDAKNARYHHHHYPKPGSDKPNYWFRKVNKKLNTTETSMDDDLHCILKQTTVSILRSLNESIAEHRSFFHSYKTWDRIDFNEDGKPEKYGAAYRGFSKMDEDCPINGTEEDDDHFYYDDEYFGHDDEDYDKEGEGEGGEEMAVTIIVFLMELYGTVYGFSYGAFHQFNYFFHVYMVQDFQPDHLGADDNITVADFESRIVLTKLK
ncbi:uncharacterized protein LOC111043783 isoform X2 [Nilaparvata lugens]|uniref:uncharacterized protein LOC111043783 isoform X2 n=1 Tax=Nilaparvata lugens TaxID=108931 RepID=UPI00193CA854|nr:uncharacterized protein LOC111043783 isoform X2 [Nilaparvata lugens]